jgi:hypothetical protein
MDITNFVLNPLTLAILVMALVQFVKDLGVKGNRLRVVSLALGFLLGFIFKARDLWPAAATTIDYLFFSLAIGLGACGIFSLIHDHLRQTSAAP